MNRDSGTDRANGGWLRRLVRPQHRHNSIKSDKSESSPTRKLRSGQFAPPSASQPKTNYQQPTHLNPANYPNYPNYPPLLNASEISTLRCGLTKKAEPPRARDVARPGACRTTRSNSRGWLRRLVRHQNSHNSIKPRDRKPDGSALARRKKPARALLKTNPNVCDFLKPRIFQADISPPRRRLPNHQNLYSNPSPKNRRSLGA